MIDQSWIEWATEGQKLLGFVVAIFTVVAGGVSWFWRRVSMRVRDGVKSVADGQKGLMARLQSVEQDIEGVKSDVRGLSTRVGEIERGMAHLATSSEVNAIDRHLAAQGAKVEALGTTLRMLYEAAMRADKGGSH